MEGYFQTNLIEHEFPFNLFINEGNFLNPHHWHEEIEIIYVIEGILKIGVNEKVYNLKAEDILIICSGDIHYFFSPIDYSKRVIIHFKHSLFDSFYSDITEKTFIRELLSSSEIITSDINKELHLDMQSQIKKLVEEHNSKKNGYKLALKARVYDLAVLMLRNTQTPSSTENKKKHSHKLDKLQKVFQFVEKNYNTDIYVNDLAEIIGFSLFHFSRFFKDNTGLTFNEYLTNYRVTVAEWLLISTDNTITEISSLCGFNTLNAFNKTFKAIKGLSPSYYRKKNILPKNHNT